MKTNFPALFLIIIVSILAIIPLLTPGLHVIHDDQQIARLFLFDEAIRFGQFPVRWVDKLGFGFGYPLFVFYPPFVYLLGEIFHLAGFGFIDSIKLVFAFSVFASGIAMYVLTKEFFGKLSATTASIFYILVPYRAVDIYVRGALAESFSFVWPPLILWSFYKLYKTKKINYVFTSSIFLALLLITHNLIFLAFIIILPFFLLFLIIVSDDKKKLFYLITISTLLAAGLSAFFWAPALLEKKHTIVDKLLLVNLANYNIHFVFPQQLWNWQWGFGGSSEGLADGLSFKIGKLHILGSAAAFIFAVTQLIKNRKASGDKIINFKFSILIFILFVLSAYMTTFYSKVIWDIIVPLSYLQFPWRFLTFTALFSSLLIGSFIFLLRIPILKLLTSIILIGLLLNTNLKLFKPQSYRPDLSDQIATSKELINWDISLSSFEYSPKGIDTYKSEMGTNIVNIQKKDIPTQKLKIEQGNAIITKLEELPIKTTFNINSETNSKVKANVFYFPGWQVEIDEKPVKIDNDNRLKLITFEVPQGRHQVEIKFEDTLVRMLANVLSLASIILIVLLIISRWLKLNISWI